MPPSNIYPQKCNSVEFLLKTPPPPLAFRLQEAQGEERERALLSPPFSSFKLVSNNVLLAVSSLNLPEAHSSSQHIAPQNHSIFVFPNFPLIPSSLYIYTNTHTQNLLKVTSISASLDAKAALSLLSLSPFIISTISPSREAALLKVLTEPNTIH